VRGRLPDCAENHGRDLGLVRPRGWAFPHALLDFRCANFASVSDVPPSSFCRFFLVLVPSLYITGITRIVTFGVPAMLFAADSFPGTSSGGVRVPAADVWVSDLCRGELCSAEAERTWLGVLVGGTARFCFCFCCLCVSRVFVHAAFWGGLLGWNGVRSPVSPCFPPSYVIRILRGGGLTSKP
jgi:hypothetical protein